MFKTSVVLLLLVHLGIISSSGFESSDAFIKALEDKVVILAKSAETIFTKRCASVCENMSYHACSTVTPPDQTCSNDYQNQLNCPNTGRYISTDYSAVRPAQWVTSQGEHQEVDLTDPGVRQDICTFAKLDPTYQKNAENSPYINWQYFSTPNGIHRSYPFHQICSLYDNRNRPWYVTGSSGPKNLMIILDNSGSMGIPTGLSTRLEIAKSAVILVINALSETDWVGLVVFSTAAEAYQPYLVQATKKNIQLLTCYIHNLAIDGNTNYEAGFREAFKVLTNSLAKEFANVGCTTVVQFMTDGEISEGMDAPQIYDLISELNSEVGATIFTYSIGSDSMNVVPQKIACIGNGIFTQAQDKDDLQTILTGFYSILTVGSSITNPIWTEPFEDASGLGVVVSVVYPAYDRSQDPPVLIGVAGVEIHMKAFESYPDYSSVPSKLAQRSKKCLKLNITDCQLEALRPQATKCGESICEVAEIKLCPELSEIPLFYQQAEKSTLDSSAITNQCCGPKAELNKTLTPKTISELCGHSWILVISLALTFML